MSEFPLHPVPAAFKSTAHIDAAAYEAMYQRSITDPEGAMIGEKLAATEKVFIDHLQSDVPFIKEAGKYLFTSGGKRVRPALLLLTSRMLGHDGKAEVTYAAVVELIHTATLIHDDIIDHAALRRRRPEISTTPVTSSTPPRARPHCVMTACRRILPSVPSPTPETT